MVINSISFNFRKKISLEHQNKNKQAINSLELLKLNLFRYGKDIIK